MSHGRRFLRGLAKVLAAFVALLVVAYVVVTIVGRQALLRELERVKASGAPVSWEEVIPPPVPDDQNAALLYEKAFAALAVPRDSRELEPVWNYMAAETAEERNALAKHARKIVAENARALSYARQAAERPKCRLEGDWSDPVAMTYSQLSSLRHLARLASWQAALHADEGSVADAFDAWSLNLSIAKHLGSDPRLVGQSARYGVLIIAAASLPRIMESAQPDVARCRSVAESLARLDLRQPLIKGLETERCIGLWALDRIRENPRYLSQYAAAMTETWPSERASHRAVVSQRFTWLGYNVISPLDKAALLRLWEKQIALARKPYRESVSQFETLDDEIPRYAVLTRACPPVFIQAVGARDRVTATVGLMAIALGLAAYRTQLGRYPESLGQLREALKWRIPEDPFSGGDFIYRREGAGYVLYSLGPDLDDDGGAPEHHPGRAPGDYDIVWRMER